MTHTDGLDAPEKDGPMTRKWWGFERDLARVMFAIAHGQDVKFVGPNEDYTKRVFDEAKRRLGLPQNAGQVVESERIETNSTTSAPSDGEECGDCARNPGLCDTHTTRVRRES